RSMDIQRLSTKELTRFTRGVPRPPGLCVFVFPLFRTGRGCRQALLQRGQHINDRSTFVVLANSRAPAMLPGLNQLLQFILKFVVILLWPEGFGHRLDELL